MKKLIWFVLAIIVLLVVYLGYSYIKFAGPDVPGDNIPSSGNPYDDYQNPFSAFAESMNLAAANSAVLSKIKYPVSLLGGCANREACYSYCEKPDNMNACIDFALSNGLMTRDQAVVGREAAKRITRGEMPGNCQDRLSCESYCETHLKECLVSVKKDQNISKEMKNLLELYANDEPGPGGCKWGPDCERYCSDQSHFDECLNYAKNHELVSAESEEAFAEIPPQAPFVQYPKQYRAQLEKCARAKLGDRFDDLFQGKIRQSADDDAAVNGCLKSVLGI